MEILIAKQIFVVRKENKQVRVYLLTIPFGHGKGEWKYG